MNRRTALKIVGSALFAPIVKLRQAVDQERLLRAFCDDDSGGGRYDLADPFSFGSLTYASDYRHVVRAELSSRIEDGTRRIPDVHQVWDRYWQPSQFVPFELPDVDSPLLLMPDCKYGGVCPLCDDRRLSFGEHYPSSQEESDALIDYDPDDNTVRDSSCPLCNGQTFLGPSQLLVCGVKLSYSRLKPLAALPNVRVAGNLRQESTEGPLVFKADGFEGLAMGIEA